MSASTGEDVAFPGASGRCRPAAVEVASAPIERRLLPMTAAVDEQDRLSVGGVDLVSAAEEFGTPLFVYDEAHLRARCREAVEAWGDGVAYATKAFLCLAMARLAAEEGMCLDVSTGGELHVALSAGVPGDRLVMHGNNKSDAELAAALAAGVGRIVVDSFDEIDRLERLCTDAPTAPARPRAPRCSSASPPASRSTPTSSCAPARTTPSSASAWPPVQPTGPSPASPSWPTGASSTSWACTPTSAARSSPSVPFVQAVDLLARFFAPLGLPELVVGGGLGVPYVTGEEAPPMAQWAGAVRRACAEAGIPAGRSGSPPSRDGRSWPRRPSPSTGWARSSTSPGTAPTWPSTAA